MSLAIAPLKMECASRNNVALRNSDAIRSSFLGTATRHDLTAIDAEISDCAFDCCLGAPLARIESATLDLIGGKALQCWRLSKHGFPVPTAFAIPTFVYNLHIESAGVVDAIQDVFDSDWKDLSVRDDCKVKLEKIREAILATPLDDAVIENLGTFVETTLPGEYCSVRSSGTSEDLVSQSFAGQYDTFLFKRTVNEVCSAIKMCWASMFKPHILEYAKQTEQARVEPPKMGVLVMKMIHARTSGVCFTENVWGSSQEVMIEAVLGQGQGLVSGEIIPDRYVLDKDSLKVSYQDLQEQKVMFVQAGNQAGVAKIEMDTPHGGPVLTERDLKAITRLAKAIQEFYNAPQDIEWAIGCDGQLYLLQARPLTTAANNASLSFLPPGDGFWTFDPIHFPRPFTPWQRQSYSFGNMGAMGRRAGSLLKDIQLRYIHNFAFLQPQFQAPSKELERAAEAYWSKKLYEDDYREFCDFFRPDCMALQDELRNVNPSSLGYNSLAQYVAKCFDYAAMFWKLHHTYSTPTSIIVGDYMNRMSELTGEDAMDTLVLLENASPDSRGLLNLQDPMLAKLYTELRANKRALALLKTEEANAAWALDCLMHMPNILGEMMRKVALKYGWRLTGGYDLIVPCLIESPYFFLKTLSQGVMLKQSDVDRMDERVQSRISEWKAKVPEEKHAEFERVLNVGRKLFRIRDERGLYTDLSGVGLCRRGILEGGHRLVDQGVIFQADHLTVATKSEALALLAEDQSLLERKDGHRRITSIPSAAELERRYKYIMNADPSLVPRSLGKPPPLSSDNSSISSQFPNIARTMAAIETGVARGVFSEGSRVDHGKEDATKDSDMSVKGIPASMGKVTGRVCLVIHDDDLSKVQKGDIVVTYSSTAAFNIMLGLCAGICTDYGGMLSHAAIVAREYGIPAVVGTQDATKTFQDGDIVCVDSSTGIVARIIPV